jgi:hypothetical protein
MMPTGVAASPESAFLAHARSPVAILLLLGGIFLFYAATIREGHVWDDDVAQYVLHARNIAEGRHYSDTGYIFNPEYAALGPISYPPGFPLLLAPIWALRGMDFHAMKLLEVVCMIAWLAAVYAYFRREFSVPMNLFLIAVLGFCPLFWDFKDFIGSEFPFLAALYAALVLIRRAYSQEGEPSLRAVLAVSLMIFAAYSIRTVGAVLIPALLIRDLLANRRISRFTALTCSLSCTLCAAVSLYLRSAGGTLSLFHLDPLTVWVNLRTYIGMAAAMCQAGRWRAVAWALEALTAIGALWAFSRRIRLRTPPGIVEVFAVLYVAILLVYSPHEVRFLFPVFPPFIALVLGSAATLAHHLSKGASRSLALLSGGLLLFAYVGQYRSLDWGTIRGGFTDSRFLDAMTFIRSGTETYDVILFRKARLVPLLSGRRAMTYAHVPGLGSFVHTVRPRYVLAPYRSVGIFSSDADFLWPFLRSQVRKAELVYSNGSYAVYRIQTW